MNSRAKRRNIWRKVLNMKYRQQEKQEEILFGAAYYPEYMPCDRMEEDMEQMRAMGMNVIRVAESTWSSLEPTEGVFDFSWIDHILEAAERHQMKVIVGTPTYAIPAWLAKKDPDVMIRTRKGQASYGHRQIFDITNPTFLAACENVIRALIAHVAGHPAVIGYQVDNETKHFDVASATAQQRFVEYLKEKFGTTEALNDAFYLRYWSNSIARWEDFPDMSGCCHAGLSCEFERFQRKLAADFLAWQAALIREYTREDQFITHNLDFEWKKFGADIAQDGYSYGVQPGINHAETDDCLDISGTDIYHPTQDDATGAEVAFGGDIIRSLKQKPYLILETQAQAFKYWTPYPGQMRLDAISHLASGACGIMYWNWHSIHNGFETYWKGILSHDLLPNPVSRELGTVGADLKRIGADHLVIRKKNRAAIVVDNHSLSAMNWHPTDRDLSYNDVFRWMYDSLYEMNIECDVVDVTRLETEPYDLILVPELYSATEETIEKLRRFAAEGGVLLATFRSFFSDEYLSVYPDLAPHGLTECFGISYQQFTEPGRTKIEGRPVKYFMELLTAGTAEVLHSYEHPYWSAYAAVTRNVYQKGTTYYVGCYLEKDQLKGVLRQAAAEAGIPEDAFGASWPLVHRSGVNAAGHTVHYLMNYSEQPVAAVCPFDHCKDLFSGREYTAGDKIRLVDWGTAALEII